MTTPSPMQVFYAPLYSAGSNGAVVATQVKVVLYDDHLRITGALVEGFAALRGRVEELTKERDLARETVNACCKHEVKLAHDVANAREQRDQAIAQRDAAIVERDEAVGLLPKWINCSDRLPKCKEPCESMWGGSARSDTCLVLYADDRHQDSPGPHISTAFLLDYSDDSRAHYEWVYPIDRTGGLERCSSHGGPVPVAWMPLPDGTVLGGGVSKPEQVRVDG